MTSFRALSLAGLLLGGCVHVVNDALPMPARPALTFFLCAPHVCLTEADADRLAKWLDQLNAFAAARERVLKD